MSTTKILNPVKALQLSDSNSVEVRQMPFLKAMEFIKKIGALAGNLIDDKGQFKLAKFKGKGADKMMELDLSFLQTLIGDSADLMIFVIKHSTGKEEAWVEKLSAAEGMEVLKTALELNLSDEVLALGKETAVFLTGRFAKGKTASAKA